MSSKSKMLIRDMIDINVKKRLSLVQCIESPWIKMLTKIDGSFRIDGLRLLKCFDMMQNFQPLCKFRLLILNFTLNYFYFESKLDKLSKVYSYLDQRHLACLNERDLFKFAQRIYRDTSDFA